MSRLEERKEQGRKAVKVRMSQEKLVARGLLHEKTRSRSRKREEGKIELISCPIPSSSAETLRGSPALLRTRTLSVHCKRHHRRLKVCATPANLPF